MKKTNIFFDESRNTGEVNIKNNKLNYNEQRYYVLVGYISNEATTKKYKKFKDDFLEELTGSKLSKEIKGTDLLKGTNDKFLKEFINTFSNTGDFLITIYDKKYFVLSSMIMWLFGYILRDKEPIIFYRFNECLIKVDDVVLGNFIQAINYKKDENIIYFIKYLREYNFDECMNSEIDKDIIVQFKQFLEVLLANETDTISLLKEDVVAEQVSIKGKPRNNIVNLTALGEALLTYKIINQEKNEDIEFYHDNIEVVEDYMKHYFKDINIKLNFIDSKDSIEIQLADNVSSIVGKFINRLLPATNSSLNKILKEENVWIRNYLKPWFKDMGKIKAVVSLREQATIKTYVETNINDLHNFLLKTQENLDYRFYQEMRQHMTTKEVFKLFHK